MVLLKGKSDIGDKINKQIVQPLIDANTGKLAKGDSPDFNDANKLGEGQAMVDRLTKLVSIFAELDFSQNRGEDGLLAEGLDSKTINARLKELGNDNNNAEDKAERQVLQECLASQNRLREAKSKLKTLQQELNTKLAAKYPQLTEDEIKTLVMRDKWLSTIEQAMRAEVERVSQTLTGRVHQWAERYATPLPQLVADAEKLAARVKKHIEKMGVNP